MYLKIHFGQKNYDYCMHECVSLIVESLEKIICMIIILLYEISKSIKVKVIHTILLCRCGYIYC